MHFLKKNSCYGIIMVSLTLNLEDESHGTAMGRSIYKRYG